MRVVCLFLVMAAACSGAADPPTTDNVEPVVYPRMAFSGFDGTTRFQVPLVTNLGDATWVVEDPTIAEIAVASSPPASPIPDGDWAMVITHKPGTTKIIATSGDERTEATLIVGP